MTTDKEAKQTIFRNYTDKFTIIPDNITYSDNLSWEELGIAVFLLAAPDNEEINLRELFAQRPCPSIALVHAINELEKAGLIEKSKGWK